MRAISPFECLARPMSGDPKTKKLSATSHGHLPEADENVVALKTLLSLPAGKASVPLALQWTLPADGLWGHSAGRCCETGWWTPGVHWPIFQSANDAALQQLYTEHTSKNYNHQNDMVEAKKGTLTMKACFCAGTA